MKVLSQLNPLLAPAVFQEVIDVLDQGLVSFDPSGKLICFNRRYTELLELPADLMQGRPDKQTIVAYQRARGDFDLPGCFFDASNRPVVPDPLSDEMPSHYWRATKSGKTLEVTVAWLTSGLHIRTFSDVTRYFEAQQKLQHSAARLQRVMAAVNPGTWETNLVSGDVDINEAWAQLLGYERSELEPMTRERWRAMIHPDDIEATGLARVAFMTGAERQFDSRFRMRHSDGHWVWVRCTGKNYHGLQPDGALIVSGTLIDVSAKMENLKGAAEEIGRLQHEVQVKDGQLERAVVDMTMISSSLAHDLRTPLRAINGYASILSEDLISLQVPQAKAYAGKIAEHSATMGEMITRVLDLLQVLQARPMKQPIRISDIVLRRMEQLAPQESGIHFTCADTPEVLADPDLVNAAITQLLHNALTHSGHQSPIAVEFGYDAQEQVYFVRDHGAGFDMAMADRLFKPFSTLGLQGPSSGRGMGLAIASRCMERMGGRLWASSTPGHGSTFYFTIGR